MIVVIYKEHNMDMSIRCTCGSKSVTRQMRFMPASLVCIKCGYTVTLEKRRRDNRTIVMMYTNSNDFWKDVL